MGYYRHQQNFSFNPNHDGLLGLAKSYWYVNLTKLYQKGEINIHCTGHDPGPPGQNPEKRLTIYFTFAFSTFGVRGLI